MSGSKKTAAVIGAGFGGLALAIRLQSAGIQTVVYEKRDKPGGRAYVYTDDGFTFDAGPTVITDPDCLEQLWALSGRRLSDDVTLLPVSPFYQLCWEDGYRFDYADDQVEIDRQIACGVIVARLHQHMSVWDLTARFEHVGKDRITDILCQAMSAFPGAIGKLWLSGVVARKDDAQRTAANLFADALAPFEILSETSIDELLRVKFPPILPAAHALRASWP
jgi:phytoene dehydrogenase-like protein